MSILRSIDSLNSLGKLRSGFSLSPRPQSAVTDNLFAGPSLPPPSAKCYEDTHPSFNKHLLSKCDLQIPSINATENSFLGGKHQTNLKTPVAFPLNSLIQFLILSFLQQYCDSLHGPVLDWTELQRSNSNRRRLLPS